MMQKITLVQNSIKFTPYRTQAIDENTDKNITTNHVWHNYLLQLLKCNVTFGKTNTTKTT